jgi:6-phosphogluconolactonase (cycloisomerase 2 family)
MHWIRRFAFVTALISLGVSAGLVSAHRTLAASDVVGQVYVNDNASPNTISGFDRHTDGSLTPISGSPFAAGGTGAAVPSQGALQLSGDGRYLLAVDAGSNQVSVLRIKHDGSLQLAEGSPVSSGGVEPVSIAVHGDLVYVANDGNALHAASYTGFQLNSGGHLRPIPSSIFSLPSSATLGDVLFNPTGTHLIGTRVDTSLLDSFTVDSNGLLHPAAGSPFPTQTGYFGPFGSKFSPSEPDNLYVSNAHNSIGGAAPGTVSAFEVASDGTFSPIGASPYSAGGQIATCWIDISHNGNFLFGVNTGSNSVSSFSIASDGSLSLIGSTSLKGSAANHGALDDAVSPDDQFVYVVERGANVVAGLRINADGSLTELASSPTSLPAGSTAFGVVAN